MEAFVLRMRPLGEADRILTLFCQERGKLDGVAKGVRKTRSKFGARLDFFARSRLTLHAGRSLDIITGATLVAGAWERLVEPDVFRLVSYVAEVVDALCEPDLAVPDIYDMLCEFQEALSVAAAPVQTRSLQSVFDLRALAALGLGLELDACARCGTPLGRRPFAGGRAALSPEAGGLVCRQCIDAGSADPGEMRRELRIVRISSREFELLRQARSMTFKEAATRSDVGALAQVSHAFVQHHLGRVSKALGPYEGKRGLPRTVLSGSSH